MTNFIPIYTPIVTYSGSYSDCSMPEGSEVGFAVMLAFGIAAMIFMILTFVCEDKENLFFKLTGVFLGLTMISAFLVPLMGIIL